MQKAVKRLKIIRGQIDGLIKLIEGVEDCEKVLPQIKAIKNAFSSFSAEMGKEFLKECMKKKNISEKKIEKLVETISKT